MSFNVRHSWGSCWCTSTYSRSPQQTISSSYLLWARFVVLNYRGRIGHVASIPVASPTKYRCGSDLSIGGFLSFFSLMRLGAGMPANGSPPSYCAHKRTPRIVATSELSNFRQRYPLCYFWSPHLIIDLCRSPASIVLKSSAHNASTAQRGEDLHALAVRHVIRPMPFSAAARANAAWEPAKHLVQVSRQTPHPLLKKGKIRKVENQRLTPITSQKATKHPVTRNLSVARPPVRAGPQGNIPLSKSGSLHVVASCQPWSVQTRPEAHITGRAANAIP